jgi:alginate O-acetyltransferase complex protein AlgJ
MRPPPFRVRHLNNLMLILLFLIGLTLPLEAYLFYPAPTALGFEKRPPAPRPDNVFSATFPEQFEAYFRDVFGYRADLIAWHNYARVQWLGLSTNPVVILGKQGWRYFDYQGAFAVYAGRQPMTTAELEAWRKSCERQRDWLERRGIAYLLAIAPTKETIYPEFLPDSLRSRGRSRLDQLADYLRAHSDIALLDLREPLLKARTTSQWPLFFKTDSHWNELGAHVAYHEILTTLSRHHPQIRPSPLSDFNLVICDFVGDLCNMLGLKYLVTEKAPFLIRKTGLQVFPGEPLMRPEQHRPPVTGGIQVYETGERSLPRMVVYGDSYCWYLHKLLDPHFQRTAYLHWISGMDHRFIKQERPDIVLQLHVERYLNFPPQPDTEDEDEPTATMPTRAP